jgi:ParB family protein of integrating conjugative element (PFGI_1 class)
MNKDKPMPFPRNASIADIAEKRGLVATPSAARDRLKQQQVADSLHRPNPPSATTGMSIDYEADDSRLELPVTDIDYYDHNPRTALNSEFQAIKESIRENLIMSPLVVTKRPGARRYMLAAGGNTRLKAIQELYVETQNPRYAKTTCTYRAWRSESYVLAGHLIENEVRGDMTFWDKANGVMLLKKQLQEEEGKSISIRDLESKMKLMGLPSNISTLSSWLFSIEKLPALGIYLSTSIVRSIQPRYAQYKKLTAKFGREESDMLTWAFLPAQKVYAAQLAANESNFELTKLLAETDHAFCVFLSISPDTAHKMWSLLEQFPDLSLGELQSRLSSPSEPVVHTSAPLSSGVNGVDDDQNISTTTTIPVGSYVGLPPTYPAADTYAPNPPFDTSPPTPSVDHAGLSNPTQTLEEKIARAKTHVYQSAEKCAKDAWVAHCFNLAPATEFGYYMDFPPEPSRSIELEYKAREGCMAWWLLAAICGQRKKEVAALLPDTARWRASLLCEQGLQPGNHELVVQEYLGSTGELFDFAELIKPDNETARAALALIGAVNDYYKLVALANHKKGVKK